LQIPVAVTDYSKRFQSLYYDTVIEPRPQVEMTCLVSVGHSAIDTIYRVATIPSAPMKLLASAYAEAGGGMAANASVAAAR
jgi:hypothetical protein